MTLREIQEEIVKTEASLDRLYLLRAVARASVESTKLAAMSNNELAVYERALRALVLRGDESARADATAASVALGARRARAKLEEQADASATVRRA